MGLKLSFRYLKAITKKEFINSFRNPNILTLSIFPVFIALLYSKVFGQYPNVLNLSLSMAANINLSIVPLFVISLLITIEKEENTLRILLLSNIKPLELLIGKNLLVLVLTLFLNTIIFFIFTANLSHLVIYLLLSTFITLCMLFLGTSIGILCNKQTQISVISTPLSICFLLIPELAHLNSFLGKISKLLPHYYGKLLFNDLMLHTNNFSLISTLLVLAVWIVGGLFLLSYVYKIKGYK